MFRDNKYVVDKIRVVYDEVDRVVVKLRSQLFFPCKDGCDHCCYQYAIVYLPEVFLLVEAIRQDSVLKGYFLSKRVWLQDQIEILRDPTMNNGKWFDLHIPCVFLDDHKCLVYASRPIVCRTQLVAEASSAKCRLGTSTPKLAIIDKSKFLGYMLREARSIGESVGISWGVRPLQVALLEAWDILENNKKPVKLTVQEEIRAMMVWTRLERKK